MEALQIGESLNKKKEEKDISKKLKPVKRRNDNSEEELDENEKTKNIARKKKFPFLENIKNINNKDNFDPELEINSKKKIETKKIEEYINTLSEESEENSDNNSKESQNIIAFNPKKKSSKNNNKKSEKFINKTKNPIDELNIGKNKEFTKTDVSYSWRDMDFITKFTKKSQTANNVYLTCSKRGVNNQKCRGKGKYNIKTGILQIYEKCVNDKDLHTTMSLENFYDFYKQNNYENINMDLRYNQKLYVKCLLKDNEVIKYINAKDNFEIRFKNKIFILDEDDFRKIKIEIFGTTNNSTIEDLCKSINNIDNNIRVDIYPIKTEYFNVKQNKTEIRDQNIIIIGHNNMISFLDQNMGKEYGIDITFKVIPKTFKPYKLMSIYVLDKKIITL